MAFRWRGIKASMPYLTRIFEKFAARMETSKQGSTPYDFNTTETLFQRDKRSLKCH